MQIVVFQLGDEKYAIDTSMVQGINKTMDITKVPCSPEYVKGLVNLRGGIITVVDPNIVLGIDDDEANRENIIIVGAEDEVLGILVDKVEEVIDIERDMVKNISTSKEGESEYIKGTINMGDSLITLIDVDALLNNK